MSVEDYLYIDYSENHLMIWVFISLCAFVHYKTTIFSSKKFHVTFDGKSFYLALTVFGTLLSVLISMVGFNIIASLLLPSFCIFISIWKVERDISERE